MSFRDELEGVSEASVRDCLANTLNKQGYNVRTEYSVGDAQGRVDIKAVKQDDAFPVALFIEIKPGVTVRDCVAGMGQLLWYRYVNYIEDYSRLVLVLAVQADLARDRQFAAFCQANGIELWGILDGGRRYFWASKRRGYKARDVWLRSFAPKPSRSGRTR